MDYGLRSDKCLSNAHMVPTDHNPHPASYPYILLNVNTSHPAKF